MKKFKMYLTYILLMIILIFCIYQSEVIPLSIKSSTSFFMSKLFPFLYFNMVIVNILIGLNIESLFKNPIDYLFIMSFLSGMPLNGIIISSYIDKKIIDEHSASKLLIFTCFNSFLFIYSTFQTFFNDFTIVYRLLLAYYAPSIIIYLILRRKIPINTRKKEKENINIIQLIIDSIKKSIITMANIYAIIAFFRIISDLFITKTFALSPLFRGLIEVSQGINEFSLINLKPKIKELELLLILTFGGLAIHMQIANVLKDYNINYKLFYLFRLISIILNSLNLYLITLV